MDKDSPRKPSRRQTRERQRLRAMRAEPEKKEGRKEGRKADRKGKKVCDGGIIRRDRNDGATTGERDGRVFSLHPLAWKSLSSNRAASNPQIQIRESHYLLAKVEIAMGVF